MHEYSKPFAANMLYGESATRYTTPGYTGFTVLELVTKRSDTQ